MNVKIAVSLKLCQRVFETGIATSHKEREIRNDTTFAILKRHYCIQRKRLHIVAR